MIWWGFSWPWYVGSVC